MKRVLVLLLFVLFSWTLCLSAETIHRNILWTLEGKNDPIVHVTNESENTKTLTLRILIGTSSYRYPSDLEVPIGENRFVRVQEVVQTIGKRYPELLKEQTGLLQIEFEGTDADVKTRLVNLNPKIGITAEKEADRIASPAIDSIEPATGSVSGGTVVTIVGNNFTDSTAVKFGGIPVLHNLQSAEVMIAVTPSHSGGTVDVEVSNGKKASKLAKAFRYQAEGPVLIKVDPEKGPIRGGTQVTLTGRNFQAGAAVYWNGIPLTARYLDSNSLAVTTPAGQGSVSIEVRDPEGRNSKLPTAFTYRGVPRIFSISPELGKTEGGYILTVNGENFEPGNSVMFGNSYGPTTFVNPRALAATVPPGETGPVDITVTTQDGESVTLRRAFMYDEPPQINSIKVEPNPILRLTNTIITVQASHPQAEPLEYDYRVSQGPAGCGVAGNGNTATFSSSNTPGTAVVLITVTDLYGAKTTGTITITIN